MAEMPSAEFLALQEGVAGRYFLERELGRGGMGIVYLARDVSLDRLVAIKLLPPALAMSGDLRARFLREARTAAQLSHPHIVPIHSVEEHEALVFFVMGYVDGQTLGSTEATRVMQEVAWALSHAHARGVIHRDVKPDNILLERETGRALVTDFGIARAAASDTPAGGVVIGTPQYMSPEQARGDELDGRSDLYSLGATFFFALTGRLPIEAPSVSSMMTRLLIDGAPSVASVRAVLAAPLAQAVDRCLATAPERRFASAAELAETLRTALASRPETPSPIRRFLTEIDAAASEAGTAATASLASIAVLGLGFGLDDFAGVVFYTISAVTGGLAAIRIARLTGDARRLLESGYGLEAVRRSLAIEERSDGSAPPPRSVARSMKWLAGGVLLSVGGIALAQVGLPTGPSLIGAAVAVVAPTIAIRRVVQDWIDERSGLRRLMNGRVGNWLFAAAGLGRGRQSTARVAAGEPTVVAIARAADQLYSALPATQRTELGNVPAVINRLEAEALASRGQDGADPEREASAVAALESLRLDLLRLSAGGAPKGELTRDLAEAERIGKVIDARLEKHPSPAPNG